MARRDDQVLQAIGHTRIHLASGLGLETVIFLLAHERSLGKVARRCRAALSRLERGEGLEDALRKVHKSIRGRGESLFFGALLGEGHGLDRRLAGIEDEIVQEGRTQIERYEERVVFWLRVAAVVFVASFGPPVFHVFTTVPSNPVLPAVKLSAQTIATYFTALDVLFGIVLLNLWAR